MLPAPSRALRFVSEDDVAGRKARTDFARLRAPASDVLRIVSDSRTPVFFTVHAGGRIRYGYWRPVDSDTGRGGCYVALPTDVCEELRSGGRIALGEPVTDPSKTTYRVSTARTAARTGREEDSAA